MTLNHSLYILGVADPCLSSEQQEMLGRCTTLFASERLRPAAVEHVPDIECRPITPLSEALAAIDKALARGSVAIIASGDPLFFGIGRTLLRRFESSRLHFFPALSSIQRAAALFRLPWDDARLLSLHGRSSDNLPGLLLRHPKSLLLTDQTNSPGAIAATLVDYLRTIDMAEEAEAWQMQVAENIGNDRQRLSAGPLQTMQSKEFAPLNVVCLQHRRQPQEPVATTALGLSEDEIVHSRGLITKNEVRAATLHALRLPRRGILWDVGAGSGSISIEAARLTPDLTIYAVDHKEEEIANIKTNIRRFRTFNVIPVFGHAPGALAALPAPDRIFVGGSTGTLGDLIAVGAELLPAGGRLVINGVIARTVEAAPRLLKAAGFTVSTSQITVNRRNEDDDRVDFNPVTITVGIKQESK